MEYYLLIKKKSYQSHEKAWRKLNCILLGEASLKMLYTISSQLYDILEKAKLWRLYKISDSKGFEGREREKNE